jgi:peptidoglycan/LPS O-acetylase OafA/YrhL
MGCLSVREQEGTMNGSAVYGLIGGLVFVVMTSMVPQPTGSVVFWSLSAGHFMWGAAICWRRTRLPLATTAMIIGAVMLAAFAVLAGFGRVFPDFPRAWWPPIVLAMVAGPLCLLAESRLHRRQWAEWRDYMADKSAWDIVTARHIPTLHH